MSTAKAKADAKVAEVIRLAGLTREPCYIRSKPSALRGLAGTPADSPDRPRNYLAKVSPR